MTVSLRDFVLNAVEMSRIRFADLRRLQRDILPYRITRREEVEMLLSLDATVERADRDWREYLVPAVAQFAVWGVEPIGRINRAKADWLLEALALAPPKTASAIIRNVVIDIVVDRRQCRSASDTRTRSAAVSPVRAGRGRAVEKGGRSRPSCSVPVAVPVGGCPGARSFPVIAPGAPVRRIRVAADRAPVPVGWGPSRRTAPYLGSVSKARTRSEDRRPAPRMSESAPTAMTTSLSACRRAAEAGDKGESENCPKNPCLHACFLLLKGNCIRSGEFRQARAEWRTRPLHRRSARRT